MNKRYVYAIKIYLKNGYQPMADLAFGEGGRPTGETVTIPWDVEDERNKYYYNSYTLVWDTRTTVLNMSFEDYVHWKSILINS